MNSAVCLHSKSIFFQQQMVNAVTPPPGGIQIVQQIVGPNGEIQQIPIQLTSQQLQMIRTQMTGMIFDSNQFRKIQDLKSPIYFS